MALAYVMATDSKNRISRQTDRKQKSFWKMQTAIKSGASDSPEAGISLLKIHALAVIQLQVSRAHSADSGQASGRASMLVPPASSERHELQSDLENGFTYD
jgi:hypothetical protein